MKYIAFALLLALASPALAAFKKPVNTTLEGSGCPVAIEDFNTGPVFNVPAGFQLKFKNESGKEIIGFDLGLDIMTPVGDFVPYFQTIQQEARVQPSKSTHFLGRLIPVDEYRDISGFRLYVKKLAFSDGSTWQDDGTMKCQTVHDMRRR